MTGAFEKDGLPLPAASGAESAPLTWNDCARMAGEFVRRFSDGRGEKTLAGYDVADVARSLANEFWNIAQRRVDIPPSVDGLDAGENGLPQSVAPPATGHIAYLCSSCAQHSPEQCTHDRTDLVALPDGRWLCHSCAEADGIHDPVEMPPLYVPADRAGHLSVAAARIDRGALPANKAMLAAARMTLPSPLDKEICDADLEDVWVAMNGAADLQDDARHAELEAAARHVLDFTKPVAFDGLSLMQDSYSEKALKRLSDAVAASKPEGGQ